MKKFMRDILLFVFATVFIVLSSSSNAQFGALTIGSAIQNLGELAKQLENSAQALLQQGNTAIAQQQALAAGILRQLVVQLSDTYKGRLDDTFDKIAVAEANVGLDVENVLEQVKQLEGKTAADAQNIVYGLQGSVNQILNKIPFVKREPAFYGMIVHDAFSEIPKKGYDLEFLGFNFTDPRLDNKPPVVTVGKALIPEENISIQEDRVQVQLPKEVKDSIGFSVDYCLPQTSFNSSIQVFFKTSRSFLFIPLNRSTSETFNSFSLAGPEQFILTAVANGTERKTSEQVHQFSSQSGQVTYGCEENNSGSVTVTLPDGAKEAQCSASWINISNTKNQGASCIVTGSVAAASGTVQGRDRECIVSDILTGGLFKAIVGKKTACNCPGGGHATLSMSGTYKLERKEETAFKEQPVATDQEFLDEVDIVIPSDELKRVTGIHMTVKRNQCPNVFDRIDIELPKEPTAIAEQSSVKGHFKATYRAERLHLQQQ